jgi:hypothetical protein
MKSLAEACTERGQYRVAADKLERNLQLNDLRDFYTIEATSKSRAKR